MNKHGVKHIVDIGMPGVKNCELLIQVFQNRDDQSHSLIVSPFYDKTGYAERIIEMTPEQALYTAEILEKGAREIIERENQNKRKK